MEILTNYELTKIVNRLRRQVCCITSEGTDPDANIIHVDNTVPDLTQADTIQILSNGDIYLVDSEGVATQLSTSISSLEMDIFLIGGQSNALGIGVAGTSPNPQEDTVYQYHSSTFSEVTDEVGAPQTGSAWPSFGITWHSLTGRRICFVPQGDDGSAQVAAADLGFGNWDTSGTLYSNSLLRLAEARQAVIDAGYIPRLRGILWCQGETDAIGINNATITQGQYTTALTTMVANYRGVFGSDFPFYIYKTGTQTSASDVGYSAIRTAQEAFVLSDPLRNRMVFRGALDFVARGMMSDTVHYTQEGYNEMGRISAETINAGLDWGWQRLGTSAMYAPLVNTNVGIGTSNPSARLHVVSGAFDDTGIYATTSANIAVASVKVENTNLFSSASCGIKFLNNTGLKSQILQYSTNATNPGPNILIFTNSAGNIRFSPTVGDIEFSSANNNFVGVKSKMFNNGQWLFCPQNTALSALATRTNTTAAAVEIQSVTQGFLLPRMTKTQRDAITAPVAGLAVYQTDNVPGLRVYNGTNWMAYTETAD